MTGYDYVTGYKGDAGFRGAFFGLTREVFGFDLQEWYDLGMWDGSFECHSLMKGDVMAANVSSFTTRFLIDGEPRTLVQFGTVATHQDHRSIGLARELMEIALEACGEGEIPYLFGHSGVSAFYPRFGFRPVGESIFIREMTGGGALRMTALDPSSQRDLDLIAEAYRRRIPDSPVLSCCDALNVFMFHCLYSMRGNLWYIPDIETVLVAGPVGKILNVYDILAPEPLDHGMIMNIGTFPGLETVHYHFHPGGPFDGVEPYDSGGDRTLYIKGDFPLEGRPFMFPLTILT